MRFTAGASASLPYSDWRKPIILAERYLRHRYEEGFKVGLAEARAEIHAEDRRRMKRYRARLKAWDARRLKAEAAGEPFDEPLPEFDDDDKAEVDA